MNTPYVRPGKVTSADVSVRVVAKFPNSAQGNWVIQMVTTLGVPSDRLGLVGPDRLESGQGMVLSIPVPDPELLPQIESICRSQGATVHVQRS